MSETVMKPGMSGVRTGALGHRKSQVAHRVETGRHREDVSTIRIMEASRNKRRSSHPESQQGAQGPLSHCGFESVSLRILDQ